MKLLASLLGCAVADYACCPYDDFGVVNPGCPLSEKTPWAMQNANADTDPAGVANHVCKAWEANIDATMEGNEDFDDWGGCGFQRHFPWAIADQVDGVAPVLTSQHCGLGMFKCDVSPSVNHYASLETGSTEFPLTTGGFSNGGTNFVFGQVTLGGVCKLWIPVGVAAIDSVSIAGVHMNGGGDSTNPDHGGVAVFPGAKLCGTAGCGGTNNVAGTAYCFSVVNIAEFMENNMPGSAVRIMNANVAGRDHEGGDPHTLPGNMFMEAAHKQFGDSIEPGVVAGGTDSQVDAGASFDVVVHFKSIWCIRHWTLVDMQADPDVNSGGAKDYPLGGSPPNHAHNDVADKRFDGGIGVCGCCDSGGERHDVDAGTTPSAQECHACGGCTEFNQYALIVQGIGGMMWPNAGAWAAFYSFITCSNNEFMIYDTGPTIVGGAIVVTSNGQRRLVHSMFYNDIRHDYSNAHGSSGDIVIRGNFRQAGDTIRNCGPGMIEATGGQRCSWNWNFVANSDPETWMARDTAIDLAVWGAGAAISRNSDTAALSGIITDVVEQHPFIITFQDDTDGAPADNSLTRTFTLDASKYFTTPAEDSIDLNGHQFSFTMHCLQSDINGAGSAIVAAGDHAALGDSASTNVRDMFPDCYMGDEIHFQYTIGGGDTAKKDHRISSWYSFVTSTSFAA